MGSNPVPTSSFIFQLKYILRSHLKLLTSYGRVFFWHIENLFTRPFVLHDFELIKLNKNKIFRFIIIFWSFLIIWSQRMTRWKVKVKSVKKPTNRRRRIGFRNTFQYQTLIQFWIFLDRIILRSNSI